MPQLLLKGVPIGNIKGVLFDKDGTLSNSEGHLSRLGDIRVNEAISLFNCQGCSETSIAKLRDLLSTAYGITTNGPHPGGTLAVASRHHNMISTATVFCLLGESWPKAFAMANEVFSRADLLHKENETTELERSLLPGALDFLRQLEKAGIICGLISNDSSVGIKNFLDLNKVQDKFKDYWSADHLPPKPDPVAVKGLCNLLRLAPSQCALIGDADSDLQMAGEAGIGLILGYVGGWSEPPTLKGCQHFIQNWNDLSVKANLKVLDNHGST